ncbi:MAG: M6 family metalloprotease domain-containing protein [Dysgonamonadaceae bacterium]|jgi:M6 family metalloprotease-like protein|nr:M6 family metalloprotease domain-containing protein [Dysgonamonadaceae bacterium]
MVKKVAFLLLIGFLLVTTSPVSAVPAVPWPVEKIQPDGSKISVYLRGDEKVHWMESPDGYTLMYGAGKYIVYAEQDAQGNLVPSKVKFGSQSAQTEGLKKGLRYSPAQVQALKEIWTVVSDAGDAPLRSSGPQKVGSTTGQRKALCVLMGFKDRPFGKSREEFEALFNQLNYYPPNGSAKGSVRDFFKENSYGQLDFTVTIAGPYIADYDMSHYVGQSNDAGYHWFAKEAAEKAAAELNLNEFADNGVLETFHILFAGYGDEAIVDGKQIWSHKWQIAPITLDDVRVSVYSCSPELRGSSGNNTTYVGVVCHELCHVFGAPDYYDTNGDTDGAYIGAGNWDLMAGGNWNDSGRQPAHINMFQKILYGWVTPTELTSFAEITAMPPSAEEPVAYTIRVNDNGEQYVLENRQKLGFDSMVPGTGLLVWHVHPLALSGYASNAGHPQQMYPVVASSSSQIPDGSVSSYGSINSCGTPFPGSAGKDAFTGRTTPAMFTWTGMETISKPLTSIKETGTTVSFRFMDGATVPVTNLQAEVTGGTVALSWTAPFHEAVLGYKIYRNDVLQYTINNSSTTTYTQSNVSNGTYEYGVRAFYEASESETETVTVTVSEGSGTYLLPVSNLQGNATLDKVSLSWTAPFSGGWMGISGNYYTSYGVEQEWESFQGTYWSPADLMGLAGYKISKIKFVPSEKEATYEVMIFKVPTEGDPVAIYRQNVPSASLNYNQIYNEITLNTPVEWNPAEGLIVGLQIHSMGGWYISVDNGTFHEGRNLFFDKDGWYTFEDLGIPTGRNFCLAAYLDGASGTPAVLSSTLENHSSGHPALLLKDAIAHTPFLQKAKKSKRLKVADIEVNTHEDKAPALIRYMIYRDGAAIGETTTTAFEDGQLNSGTTYSYCVSAVYGDNLSENVCIELTTSRVNGIHAVDAAALKFYPNPVTPGQDFYVRTETPDTLIRIYSLSGTLVKQQQATGVETKMNVRLPAGMYILSAGKEKTKIIIR